MRTGRSSFTWLFAGFARRCLRMTRQRTFLYIITTPIILRVSYKRAPCYRDWSRKPANPDRSKKPRFFRAFLHIPFPPFHDKEDKGCHHGKSPCRHDHKEEGSRNFWSKAGTCQDGSNALECVRDDTDWASHKQKDSLDTNSFGSPCRLLPLWFFHTRT